MFKWANLRWEENDLPYSLDFNDKYYANQGLEESRYVSLLQETLFEGQSLDRPYVIAEIGFGTGLNFLAAANLWIKRLYDYHPLIFITFEKQPLKPSDLIKAQGRWTNLSPFKEKFFEAYKNFVPGLNIRYFPQENIILILLIGELEDQLKLCQFQADHWMLDGFDPKKNQSCWEAKTLQKITDKSRNGCTFGSFTAQGVIRRTLSDIGWNVKKIKGFAYKRHCIKGNIHVPDKKKFYNPSKVLVTGNGVAALSSKYFASKLGLDVIAESYDPPKASNIPMISCYPAFHSHLCDYTLLNLRSFSFATNFYKELSSVYKNFLCFGLTKSPKTEMQIKKYLKASSHRCIGNFFKPVKSSGHAKSTSFYFPDACYGSPVSIIRFLKENTNIAKVIQLHHHNFKEYFCSADSVILADSLRASTWSSELPYPKLLRGELAFKNTWQEPTFDRLSFNPCARQSQSIQSFVGFRANLDNHIPLIEHFKENLYTNLYHGSRGYTTGFYGGLVSALAAAQIFHYQEHITCESFQTSMS